MRTLYAERQAALVSAARRHFAGVLELCPADAGRHLVAWPGRPAIARLPAATPPPE